MIWPRLTIGTLELDTPVLAAPIAGFTDAIFRRLIRELGGCGLLFTEMVWAEMWVQSGARPPRLRGVDTEPRPLAVQLWGREPAAIAEAARRLGDENISLIDLNFGCPKRRIAGRHAAGASLLRDPSAVGGIVAAAVRGAGGRPVTAKIRGGPSLDRLTAPAVARCAQENGAAAVTVHGRAADQDYSAPCSLDVIAAVVDAVSIPVIANGDIGDAVSALRALRGTGAAGVMIGRAALTRPWAFREIAAALRGEPLPPPPTAGEQRARLLRHHAAMVAEHGDPLGTVLMRKFACRYVSGATGGRGFRDAIVRARDAAEFLAVVEHRFPDAAAGAPGGAAE